MASPQGGSTAGFGRIRSYRPNKTRVRPPFPGTFSSRPLFLRAAQCHMGGMSDEKPWPDSIRAGECEQHEPLVRRVLAPNPSPSTFTSTQTWIAGAGSDVAVIDPGPHERDGVGTGQRV